MKTKVLFFSALLFAGFGAQAHATALTLPHDEAAQLWSALPKPVKVVRFHNIPQRFADAIVQVEMTIDAEGRPRDIRGKKPLPSDLASRVVPALSQWTFTPARDKDGNPVAIRVVLPLRLVNVG